MIDGRVRVTFGAWLLPARGQEEASWNTGNAPILIWLSGTWSMRIKNPLSRTCGRSYLCTLLYICYSSIKITKDFVIFTEWHQHKNCINWMGLKTQQESPAKESSPMSNFSKYLNAHDLIQLPQLPCDTGIQEQWGASVFWVCINTRSLVSKTLLHPHSSSTKPTLLYFATL